MRWTKRAGDAKQELRTAGRQGVGGEAWSFFGYFWLFLVLNDTSTLRVGLIVVGCLSWKKSGEKTKKAEKNSTVSELTDKHKESKLDFLKLVRLIITPENKYSEIIQTRILGTQKFFAEGM